MSTKRRVTVVSHGPNCLDGLTCAVLISRCFAGRKVKPLFASNREIDDVLVHYQPRNPSEEELWVTDISWNEMSTDRHLNNLVDQGLELYWIDHHKSAIDRRNAGELDVAFTGYVLDDSFAASRLLYDYLGRREVSGARPRPGLAALHRLVMLADDVDRWILDIEGSRDLALAIRAMNHDEAFKVLLAMDSNLTYGPELRAAAGRVKDKLEVTFNIAERTRCLRRVDERGLTVVACEANGYGGEIADRWSSEFSNAVFVIYDRLSDAVSFRRTPDCDVDLSRLAGAFGGGGHAAAAGCDAMAAPPDRSEGMAVAVAAALAQRLDG
ncbi:MAG: hypothetical protein ACE5E4_00825 [Candidatus Binatia bacterium]